MVIPRIGNGGNDPVLSKLNDLINRSNGGSSYLFVPAGGTPAENGQALLDAYVEAAGMTPNGNPLSATNRVTILCGPGDYSFSSTPRFNTNFIDLGSLNGERNVIIDAAVAEFFAYDMTVIGFRVTGVFGIYGWADHDIDDDDVKNENGQENLVCINCEGSSASFSLGGSDNIANKISGKFVNCKGGVGCFGNKAGSGGNSVPAIISGTFIDCEAGDSSFGRGNEATQVSGDLGVVVNGYFENCKSGDNSFGSGSPSGKFSSGTLSHVTGTFIDCEAGTRSFGFNGRSDVNANLQGTFINCRAGFESFGGGAGVSIGGEFIRCISGENSYKATLNRGKSKYCIITKEDFPTPGNGGAVLLGQNEDDDIVTSYAGSAGLIINLINDHEDEGYSISVTENSGTIIENTAYVYLVVDGTYDLEVSKSGYVSHNETITVSGADVEVTIPELTEA